ncbi:hypothetical protein HYQ44_009504 [Verticillium longisporum]|nr:hypothetical protein HYQ44_009504 [Verticillium longisporum]
MPPQCVCLRVVHELGRAFRFFDQPSVNEGSTRRFRVGSYVTGCELEEWIEIHRRIARRGVQWKTNRREEGKGKDYRMQRDNLTPNREKATNHERPGLVLGMHAKQGAPVSGQQVDHRRVVACSNVARNIAPCLSHLFVTTKDIHGHVVMHPPSAPS